MMYRTIYFSLDTSSGVKYLISKKYFKVLLSSFCGYLYFTIHIFDKFYFTTTLLKKPMYFLLHTFYLTPKSDILNA